MSSYVSKSIISNEHKPTWNAGLRQTHQMPLPLSPDEILASGYAGVSTSHFPLLGSLLIIPLAVNTRGENEKSDLSHQGVRVPTFEGRSPRYLRIPHNAGKKLRKYCSMLVRL